MPSYRLVQERVPTYKRSDGILQYLVPTPRCKTCSKPILEKYAESQRCYECSWHQSQIDGAFLRRVVAATFYIPKGWAAPHNDEIWILKESGEYAAQYAEVLAYVLREEGVGIGDNAVLVPIPPTTDRGPNAGPYALTCALSDELGMPSRTSLHFVRDVRSQKSLSEAERIENVKGAMSCDGALKGSKVFLVDDVLTTGSTMMEGARAVWKAGARRAIGLVAGRDVSIEHLEHVGVLVRK